MTGTDGGQKGLGLSAERVAMARRVLNETLNGLPPSAISADEVEQADSRALFSRLAEYASSPHEDAAELSQMEASLVLSSITDTVSALDPFEVATRTGYEPDELDAFAEELRRWRHGLE